MAPTSYQGRLKSDEEDKKTFSQTDPTAVGERARTPVSTILAEKGAEVFTIAADTTVQNAAEQLSARKIGALLVADGDAVDGIVSERDIVRHVRAAGAAGLDDPVADIMTRDPRSCAPGDDMRDIMTSMTDGRFRHMPVLDDGRLCGLISIGDVVRHRLLELDYEALKMKQAIVG